jgi:uncharacterized repeat protein (TIGR02543 family)
MNRLRLFVAVVAVAGVAAWGQGINEVEGYASTASSPASFNLGRGSSPAIIEIYAFGAGGGGQGGHNQTTSSSDGTGGGGGGGAAVYAKFRVDGQVTFNNITVGSGGNGGGYWKGTLQTWQSGSPGGNGGDTKVTWGGNTFTVQGGRGGGGSGQILTGGAGGNGSVSVRPAGVLPENWKVFTGGNGENGNHKGCGTKAGGKTTIPANAGSIASDIGNGNGGDGGCMAAYGSRGGTGYVIIAATYLNKVTFNPNGGSAVTPSSISDVPSWTKIAAPTNPTKLGYTFNGWYTAQTGGSEWNFAKSTVWKEDEMLYARWTPIVYFITGAVNGGNSIFFSGSYTVESPVISLPSPTKTNYTFGGWYNSGTFTGNPVTSIPAGSTGDRTLHAKWIPNPIAQSGSFDEQNARVTLIWRYDNEQNITGKFYIYRRETSPSSGSWSLLNLSGINALNGVNIDGGYNDGNVNFGREYEYRIVFVEGTITPSVTTPPTVNSASVMVGTTPTGGIKTPYPVSLTAAFNQRTERLGANGQATLDWRYHNPHDVKGKFYVYRRETSPASGSWSLLTSSGIDAVTDADILSMAYVDNSVTANKMYEYRIVFVESTTAPSAATPPTANSASATVDTYLSSGTPGLNAYTPYNKASDTYVVEGVTYKDIYSTNPRNLRDSDHEVFRHLLSGYQLSSDGNTHLSRWVDMGRLVAPLDADVTDILAKARTIFNTRKSTRSAASTAASAGRLNGERSVAIAASGMLAEFNGRNGYAIGDYVPVSGVPSALSALNEVKTPVFWVLDRHLVHNNNVNDDRNAGTADYAYYGVGLIFHDLKLSYLETGNPFFSAVSNLPSAFDENFNATIAGFRYKFGAIQDAMVSGVKNLSGVTATMAQKWTDHGEVMVGNEVSALNGYEMAEMRGVGSSTSISQTVGASMEVEAGVKFPFAEAKITVGASYSSTNENTWSTSQEFTTSKMLQHTDSRSSSKTVSNSMEYSVDVPVPPHTQVMLRQGPSSIDMSIDYDYPVVISYKVTVVALGSRRSSGSTSSFMRPIATYGIDKTSGNRASPLEIDAAENFKMLWGYRNDRTNSNMHSADTVSLNRVWTQMKQATGAVSNYSLLGFENGLSSATDAALESNFVRPIAVGMTDVKPMTVVRSTVTYTSESMNSEIYEFQPIYPLDRIEAPGLDSISLMNGSKYYVDNITLTGRNDRGVDYYGFHGDKGGWALTDAAGNPHNGGIARLTKEAGTGRPIIVADGSNTGVVYMRYIIKDGVYSHAGSNGYMTASDLGMRTAIIPVYVKAAGSLGIAAQPQGGKIAAASAATYPLAVEVVATGNVSYQWYINTVPSNTGGLPIPGATGSTYNAPLGTIGVFYYYVVASIDDPSVEPVVSMLAMVQVEEENVGAMNSMVTFSAGTNGTIRATVDGIPIAYGAPVQQGKSVAFTAIPNESYRVSGWTVNGIAIDGNTADTYTLSVSAATAVAVSFEKTISVASPDRVIPATNSSKETVVVAPVNQLTAEFTAGPNPVGKSSGVVKFFRQGSRIASAPLLVIYDASGNAVKKVGIADKAAACGSDRRAVGSWNLKDAKGRPVPAGTYLVKGTVKTAGGKRERVSVAVSVR